MKVSIENILGSARKISSQRNIEEDTHKEKRDRIKTDTVSISKRVDSRLEHIESEFKTAQSSLTKNQIIKNGIDGLQDVLNKGKRDFEPVFGEATFEGKRVLEDFMGAAITRESLEQKGGEVQRSIANDITSIRRLQVELDNIRASNLAGSDKIDTVYKNLQSALDTRSLVNLSSISSLKPDAVMRLIQ